MKQAVVTGFKAEARNKFHRYMEEGVKNYDHYDRRAVEQDVFDRCSDQLAAGEDMDYELSMIHTKSGNTELLRFDEGDFTI
jgi:nucleoid-associated protein YejK